MGFPLKYEGLFNMGGNRQKFLISFSLITLMSLASSCALPGSSSRKHLKQCVLSSDQAGTLAGSWRALPVPFAFFAGSFSSSEINDISAAAATWNEFSNVSLGQSIIDTGGGRTSSIPKPVQVCQTGIIQNGKFTGNVVIYKDGVWPYTNMPNAIALTSYCLGPSGGLAVPSLYMAIMEVNYQNFFISGKKLPDLRSIVLHEMGHMIGLNHSCEATGKTGTPACSSSPPDYFSAVMFPVFGFDASGLGESKRVLQDNDEGRANCLYIPGAI